VGAASWKRRGEISLRRSKDERGASKHGKPEREVLSSETGRNGREGGQMDPDGQGSVCHRGDVGRYSFDIVRGTGKSWREINGSIKEGRGGKA